MNIIEFLKNEETNISDEDRATLIKEYYELKNKVEKYESERNNLKSECNLRMDLCKGALISLKIMLEHSSGGTHRMRNFYNSAMVDYINRLSADMREFNLEDCDYCPF